LLPADLLSYSVTGAVVVPHFLGEQDHPWLRVLLEEHERFIGRPQRELEARLREPLPCDSPPSKLRLATRVLARLQPIRRKFDMPPSLARARVFGEAARTSAPPKAVLSAVASSLGVSTDALGASLFADLPGERLVGQPTRALSPLELALRCNLALVQGMLFRAAAVKIEVDGNTRVVVRHAKWRGLICSVAARADGIGASVELSGPFALFRNTRLYGRALGELVPLLSWCPRFRLHAECVIDGRRLTLQLGAGDPIFPSMVTRRYDSLVEERFAREFRRLAPCWDVIREPEPISAGGPLIFPDFALRHRLDPARQWFLEIAGFWTPDYVARKLALYRRARLPNLILCVDERRNCAEADLPSGAQVLRYRRRVDAAAVLRVLEASGWR